MRVTLHRDRVHSVSIQGEFTGPFIDLDLDPADAYSLLQALDANREGIRDMATNYYSCRDCGNTHPKTVCACPVIKAWKDKNDE